MKYARCIQTLDSNEVYIPITIVQHGMNLGLISADLTEQRRVRVSMSRLRQDRCFPDLGDGAIKLKKYRAYVGWLGIRWKIAILQGTDAQELCRDEHLGEVEMSPKKYMGVIRALNKTQLYTAGTIARFAVKQGLIAGADLKKEQYRLRRCMVRLCANHAFPWKGDGTIKTKGQAARPAWFGYRWQEAYLDP